MPKRGLALEPQATGSTGSGAIRFNSALAAYYGAMHAVAVGVVRYVGVPPGEHRRLRKINLSIYFSEIVLSVAGGLMNPLGIKLVLESALPPAAGANCAFIWLRHYIPRATVPVRGPDGIPYMGGHPVYLSEGAICWLPSLGRSLYGLCRWIRDEKHYQAWPKATGKDNLKLSDGQFCCTYKDRPKSLCLISRFPMSQAE